MLSQLWWPQDNRHIVFFREQGGDENWQAHRIDIVTGDIRALTPGPGVKSYVQQVSARFPGELLISHNQRDKTLFRHLSRQCRDRRKHAAVARRRLLLGVHGSRISALSGACRYRADGGYDLVKATGEQAGSLFRRVEAADAFHHRDDRGIR